MVDLAYYIGSTQRESDILVVQTVYHGNKIDRVPSKQLRFG